MNIPFDEVNNGLNNALNQLADNLMEKMKLESRIKTRNHKGGSISEIQTFYPAKSKESVDEIDCVLKEIYSFSEDDLDYIINFDYKFRAYEDYN